MSKLFEEEQKVLDALLAEWYEEIKSFTQDADGIFSEKGKMYDRTSPVWERIRFPHGFVQELRKKTDRVDQLLECYEAGEVRWEEVSEELGDIFNYSRMFGALITMYLSRKEPSPSSCQTAERVHQACNGDDHPYLHQTDMTTTHPPSIAQEEAVKAAKAMEQHMIDLAEQAERQPKDYLNGDAYTRDKALIQDLVSHEEAELVKQVKEYVDGDWVGTREKEKES